MSETDPVVKALLRERYGKSTWWKTPPKNRSSIPALLMPSEGDVVRARRRKELEEAALEAAADEEETA